MKRKLGQTYHLETIFPKTHLKIAIVAHGKFLEPEGTMGTKEVVLRGGPPHLMEYKLKKKINQILGYSHL